MLRRPRSLLAISGRPRSARTWPKLERSGLYKVEYEVAARHALYVIPHIVAPRGDAHIYTDGSHKLAKEVAGEFNTRWVWTALCQPKTAFKSSSSLELLAT